MGKNLIEKITDKHADYIYETLIQSIDACTLQIAEKGQQQNIRIVEDQSGYLMNENRVFLRDGLSIRWDFQIDPIVFAFDVCLINHRLNSVQ